MGEYENAADEVESWLDGRRDDLGMDPRKHHFAGWKNEDGDIDYIIGDDWYSLKEKVKEEGVDPWDDEEVYMESPNEKRISV